MGDWKWCEWDGHIIKVLFDGEPFDAHQGLLLCERDIIRFVLIWQAAIPGESFTIFIYPSLQDINIEVGMMADMLTQVEHVSGSVS